MRRPARSGGSKLAKLRNSPERFFADSKSSALRALGGVVAPRLASSALVMALLEDPLEALCERDLPGISAVARHVASREARARRERIERAGRPTVSVVVAARNAEDCVERSIGSLLDQTHREVEVVVVDDASDDRTPEIVAALASETPRVRWWRNDRQRGAAASRNVGLARATGAYLTFQDADDRSHPERLERQLAALLDRPGAVLCTCNHRRETSEGRRVVVNGRRFARNFISMMFPRDPVLERVGFMRELRVGEDAEYYERIRAVFGLEHEVHLFQTLYLARFAPGSLLFSHGDVTVAAEQVTYVQSPEQEDALRSAMEQVEAIRRAEASPYVPFAD